jgi:hypothetical protein
MQARQTRTDDSWRSKRDSILGPGVKLSLVAHVAPRFPGRDRRRRRGGSFGFVLFGEPFHRAGLRYGLGGLRLAALLGRFDIAAIELKDVLAGRRLFEPVEKLGGRIDLVVMLAVGEDGHLVQVFGKPRCILRDGDKAFSIIAVCACIRMIFSQSGW